MPGYESDGPMNQAMLNEIKKICPKCTAMKLLWEIARTPNLTIGQVAQMVATSQESGIPIPVRMQAQSVLDKSSQMVLNLPFTVNNVPQIFGVASPALKR